MRTRTIVDLKWPLYRRPPDWRWLRALQLARRGRRGSAKHDDLQTRRAVKFLLALKGSSADKVKERLADYWLPHALATQVFLQGGHRRQELECRVLAREGQLSIARSMGLPVEAVQVYLGWFFDVTDHIEAASWIVRNAVGATMPFEPLDMHTVMRLHSYFGGPEVLAAWLEFLPHAGQEHDLTTPLGRQREMIELSILIHALPVDESTAKYLRRLPPGMATLDASTLSTRGVAEILADHVAQALDRLAWGTNEHAAASTLAGQPSVRLDVESLLEGVRRLAA